MKDKMPDKFDMDHQWKLFLQRINLKEERMSEIQKRAMKQAFMGAVGQLLILLRDDVSALPEQDAMQVFQYMLEQVGEFWEAEVLKDPQN